MKIEVEAVDQAAAEEKVKRENPSCTVAKVGSGRPLAWASDDAGLRNKAGVRAEASELI